ncbi:MAG TPA: hypothetical protein VEQ85_14415 [Lacipirellulaceae bacterium]|nr:hypothetical protein [Lacipirellulaceae bacterium]
MPETVLPENLDNPRLLRQDLEDLKREHEVTAATQSGAQATQAAMDAGAQATQAATQAGQAATTAATQAGQASTMAASQAGMWSTMAAGSASLIVGIFLGLAIARS